MPDLDKKYFSGENDIPVSKIGELETGCSESAIKDTLTKLGWEGQAIASVILRISADGKQVSAGQFQLEGPLSPSPIVIQAAKLWEKAGQDIMLSITVPSGNAFVFEGGRLTSDYLERRTGPSRGGERGERSREFLHADHCSLREDVQWTQWTKHQVHNAGAALERERHAGAVRGGPESSMAGDQSAGRHLPVIPASKNG